MTSVAIREPSTRYAPTSDGLKIAVSTEGTGPVCVHMPLVPWTNSRMMSEVAARLAPGRQPAHDMGQTIVRYDVRGTGLSEGDAPDLSLDAQLLDLAAVVDHVAADQVALLAPVHSGPAAIAYTAQNPERVSHLILWCAYARAADFFGQRSVSALRDTFDLDWELFTEYVALDVVGWGEAKEAKRVAAMVRESVVPMSAAAAFEALSAVDVTPMLGQLRVPTLLLQRRQPTDRFIRRAPALAASIPGARLVFMEESALASEVGLRTDAVRRVINDFLSEPPREAASVEDAPARVALEQAVDVRLATETDGDDAPAVPPLSPREVEVLRLLMGGSTNAEIAEELVLSVRTVEQHLRNIYGKLDVHGRAEAVAVAINARLV